MYSWHHFFMKSHASANAEMTLAYVLCCLFFACLCKKTPFFTGRKVKKNMRPANWFGLSFYSCSSVLWIAHYKVLSKSVWSCLRLYCHFQFLLQLQYYTECIRHLDWTSVKVMRWLFWLILIFFSEGHFMTWSFGLSPNPKRRDKSSLSKTLYYRHIVKFDVLGNRNWKLTLLRQVRNLQSLNLIVIKNVSTTVTWPFCVLALSFKLQILSFLKSSQR